MSDIAPLYKMLRDGLEMTPGPADQSFAHWWELYTDVTHTAGTRLLEKRFGSSFEAAHEVLLFLERFPKVAKIGQHMPVNVPGTAFRATSAMGRFIESTPHLEALVEFFSLASPVVNDVQNFIVVQLGRDAAPVVDALSVTARCASIMTDQLPKTLPLYNLAQV